MVRSQLRYKGLLVSSFKSKKLARKHLKRKTGRAKPSSYSIIPDLSFLN